MTSHEQFRPPGANAQQPAADRVEDPRPPPPGPQPEPAAYQAHPDELQAAPHEYQAYPPGYQPPPPRPEPPGYQQTVPGYPAQQQQYGYQQPPYQQDQFQQHQFQQHQFQQHPGPQKSGRMSPWLIAAAVIALLVPIGIGGWYAVGRDGGSTEKADEPDEPTTTDKPDEPDTTEPDATEPDATEPEPTEPVTTDEPTEPAPSDNPLDIPTDPQLRHTIEIDLDPDDEYEYIPIEGTADDLWIAKSGGHLVTRYIDGEPKAEGVVGLEDPGYFRRWRDTRDGDLLLYTSYTSDLDSTSIARLDPESAATEWEITSDLNLTFKLIDDRLFVIEERWAEDITENLVEYDIETGAELNRISGDNFEWIDDEFVLIDGTVPSIQKLDLALQPSGPPTTIELTDSNPQGAVTVDRYGDGWVYYVDRTDSGGQPTVIGVSASGEKQFECPTSVAEGTQVRMQDDSTVTVESWDAAEVLDVNGSACTSRWSWKDTGYDSISFYYRYPVVRHRNYDEPDGSLTSTDIDVLAWETGEVIATGKDVAIIGDRDQMITFAGDQFVSKGLVSGDVQWAIDAPGDTDIDLRNGMLIVTTKDGPRGTLQIYSD